MSPLPQEMCRGRGAWKPGQSRALEKLQLPGGPISQTGHICPFLSAVCSDVRGSHRPLWAGTRTETGNQGLPWCCWWSWVLTELDLQEKLVHTPIVP